MGTFVHSPKLNFSFQNAVVLDLYAWLQGDEVLLEVELSCYILFGIHTGCYEVCMTQVICLGVGTDISKTGVSVVMGQPFSNSKRCDRQLIGPTDNLAVNLS